MKFNISGKNTIEQVFGIIEDELQALGFVVTSIDRNRPWGGFLVLDEKDNSRFIKEFFPEIDPEEFQDFPKLSPKILVVIGRLSWQYHHRRGEIWKVVRGPVGVLRSYDDTQPEQVSIFENGAVIRLAPLERHRLVGLERIGIVAEIWEHSDKDLPSDEDDIIRLADDSHRN